MDTTIERRNAAYKEVLANGTIATQTERVLDLLAETQNGLTSREIALTLRMERTSVCRTVFNLVRDGKVSDINKTVCPTTGHVVTLYRLHDWGKTS